MPISQLSVANLNYLTQSKLNNQTPEKQEIVSNKISNNSQDSFIKPINSPKNKKGIILASSCLLIGFAISISALIATIINNKKNTQTLELLSKKIQTLTQELNNLLEKQQNQTNSSLEEIKTSIEKLRNQTATSKDEIKKAADEIQKSLNELKEKLQDNNPQPQIPIDLNQETYPKAKIINFKDIVFKKGVASLKRNPKEKFTGIIKDTLRTGQEIEWEYKDGIIQKAQTDHILTTYNRKKSTLGSIKIITKEDTNTGIQKITKILNTPSGLTTKQFIKNPANNTNMQTKLFETDGREYIRACVESTQERKNPKIYKGTLKEKNEKLVNESQMSARYTLKTFDDDGFGRYQLIIDKKPETLALEAIDAEFFLSNLDSQNFYQIIL